MNCKKQEKLKTIEQRIADIKEIKVKLKEIGLSDEIDAIKQFYQHCNRFVRDGQSWSGTIKLVGFKRILQAILSNKKTYACSVSLKYDEHV